MVASGRWSCVIVRVTKLTGGPSRRRTWRARSIAVAPAPGRTGDGSVVAPRIAILPGASRVAACLYLAPPPRRAHEVRTDGSHARTHAVPYAVDRRTRVPGHGLAGCARGRGDS